MECTNDVCGMRRVGGQRRKVSEWWNEKVGRAVAEKRRAFEEWLQRVVVKRAKRMAQVYDFNGSGV